MKKSSKSLFNIIKWIFWEFFGIRFIWSKINPPIDPISKTKPPTTIFIWLFGLYVAFFGISSQRYENRIDIMENRLNAIFAQLSSQNYKVALARIPRVQNMLSPGKPSILDPSSVIKSLFGSEVRNNTIVEISKEIIEVWKNHLDSLNLDNIDLSDTDLSEANLVSTSLKNAHFENTDLSNANLKGALLSGSTLKNVNLKNTVLDDAWLDNTKIILVKVHSMRRGSDIEEYYTLSRAKTLYRSDIKNEFYANKLKLEFPELFKMPDEYPRPPKSLSIK